MKKLLSMKNYKQACFYFSTFTCLFICKLNRVVCSSVIVCLFVCSPVFVCLFVYSLFVCLFVCVFSYEETNSSQNDVITNHNIRPSVSDVTKHIRGGPMGGNRGEYSLNLHKSGVFDIFYKYVSEQSIYIGGIPTGTLGTKSRLQFLPAAYTRHVFLCAMFDCQVPNERLCTHFIKRNVSFSELET